MYASIRVMSALLAAPFLFGTAMADTELPPGAKCRQEFRSVDDQADTDVRDVDRLIDLLEGEMGDSAIASGGQEFQDHLRARLETAKARRSDILDKQHDDLNVIRARCDRLRDEQQREKQLSPDEPA
jgi:hypothetical protein